MGNRMLKESIRSSRSINALSDFQFRVWAYLITYVDDYGRGSADPELLKGMVFPRMKRISEHAIEDALVSLARAGCIHLYEVDGESYLCFPNWGQHQRIQSRKSKFPEPTGDFKEFEDVTESHGESRKVTVSHGESPLETKPNTNQIQVEENTKRAQFAPPTLEEMTAYFLEKGGTEHQAVVCHSFYESKGWMVGKTKMKSWKSAVIGWIARDKERGYTPSQPKVSVIANGWDDIYEKF